MGRAFICKKRATYPGRFFPEQMEEENTEEELANPNYLENGCYNSGHDV